MKTIYVTGATGILGANVCTQLMAKGYKARASVRDMTNSDAIALRDAGVEIVPGDLKDRDSLSKAIEGAEGVIHSGAMLGRPGATWEEGYATNVVGTMNLLSAAAEVGNVPVVQVLTTTFFDSSKTFSEDSALDLTCAFMDVYTVTKRLAYLEGMGRVREGQDIRFMVPGAIYGPSICVEKANWTNTFNDRFIKAIRGEMPKQLPLPMPWSTADDCAMVCVAALEKGVAARRDRPGAGASAALVTTISSAASACARARCSLASCPAPSSASTRTMVRVRTIRRTSTGSSMIARAMAAGSAMPLVSSTMVSSATAPASQIRRSAASRSARPLQQAQPPASTSSRSARPSNRSSTGISAASLTST